MSETELPPSDTSPDGCRLCGIVERRHHSYSKPYPHTYEAPSDNQRLDRMKRRRAALREQNPNT